MQEQEAISQCQAGEQDALGILFQLHHQAVFRTAYGITRNYDLAEDITQQVFIELFTAIKRYDPRRPFPPWLHRIAVRRSLDELRRPANRQAPIADAHILASPDTSPEQAAEESELRATIRDALGSLEAKQRAVIVLRYYHGFGEAEMAIALDCRRGRVKSRLHYALSRLREILEARASPLTGPSLTDASKPSMYRNGSTAEPVPGPHIPARVEGEPW